MIRLRIPKSFVRWTVTSTLLVLGFGTVVSTEVARSTEVRLELAELEAHRDNLIVRHTELHSEVDLLVCRILKLEQQADQTFAMVQMSRKQFIRYIQARGFQRRDKGCA